MRFTKRVYGPFESAARKSAFINKQRSLSTLCNNYGLFSCNNSNLVEDIKRAIIKGLCCALDTKRRSSIKMLLKTNLDYVGNGVTFTFRGWVYVTAPQRAGI